MEQPQVPIRWIDQWDNLNGTIERGYAGPSIFFEKGSVRTDLSRAGEYARLLASVGINGCNINNVNADPKILDDSFLPQLARVADVFRPWGVRLSVSVDLGSPKSLGGLNSFDPLDPHVARVVASEGRRRSTGRSPTSADSWSKQIQKAVLDLHPMAERRPTPPM